MRTWIKNILLRMAAGVLLITAGNFFFGRMEIALHVGINPLTAVCTGVLGLPGVFLLYGIVGCLR